MILLYLIANGGYCGNEANTMEALLLTKNIKYLTGVLIDVRMSLDNVLVLATYNDLNKNTLSNKKVSEINYQELRKIKFPSKIFKYYIPTLKEFLDKYSLSKKIFIRFHDYSIKYLDLLYEILSLYHYDYYYIIENLNLEEQIKKHPLINLGMICYHYQYFDNIPLNYYINNDLYVIINKTNINNQYSQKFDLFFDYNII